MPELLPVESNHHSVGNVRFLTLAPDFRYIINIQGKSGGLRQNALLLGQAGDQTCRQRSFNESTSVHAFTLEINAILYYTFAKGSTPGRKLGVLPHSLPALAAP